MCWSSPTLVRPYTHAQCTIEVNTDPGQNGDILGTRVSIKNTNRMRTRYEPFSFGHTFSCSSSADTCVMIEVASIESSAVEQTHTRRAQWAFYTCGIYVWLRLLVNGLVCVRVIVYCGHIYSVLTLWLVVGRRLLCCRCFCCCCCSPHFTAILLERIATLDCRHTVHGTATVWILCVIRAKCCGAVWGAVGWLVVAKIHASMRECAHLLCSVDVCAVCSCVP